MNEEMINKSVVEYAENCHLLCFHPLIIFKIRYDARFPPELVMVVSVRHSLMGCNFSNQTTAKIIVNKVNMEDNFTHEKTIDVERTLLPVKNDE